jgi:hypothetical protein
MTEDQLVAAIEADFPAYQESNWPTDADGRRRPHTACASHNLACVRQ